MELQPPFRYTPQKMYFINRKSSCGLINNYSNGITINMSKTIEKYLARMEGKLWTDISFIFTEGAAVQRGGTHTRARYLPTDQPLITSTPQHAYHNKGTTKYLE